MRLTMRWYWYSSPVHIFVLLFTTSTFCLDYEKLSMDVITGDLVKPQYWSLTEFHLVKELRVKVISYTYMYFKTKFNLPYVWLRSQFIIFRNYSVTNTKASMWIQDCSQKTEVRTPLGTRPGESEAWT